MVLGHVVLLLPMIDRAQPVPRVVVAPITSDRHPEARHGLLARETRFGREHQATVNGQLSTGERQETAREREASPRDRSTRLRQAQLQKIGFESAPLRDSGFWELFRPLGRGGGR